MTGSGFASSSCPRCASTGMVCPPAPPTRTWQIGSATGASRDSRRGDAPPGVGVIVVISLRFQGSAMPQAGDLGLGKLTLGGYLGGRHRRRSAMAPTVAIINGGKPSHGRSDGHLRVDDRVDEDMPLVHCPGEGCGGPGHPCGIIGDNVEQNIRIHECGVRSVPSLRSHYGAGTSAHRRSSLRSPVLAFC